MKKRICGTLEVENDGLFYKITGEGTPILLIAGGGGDGDLFLPMADILSQQFQVITYDRRANARSTMNFPNHFDIAQQARDAMAIVKRATASPVYVFGNSSGAVIALEMARLFPEAVRGAMIHEAPLAKLHPDSAKWCGFFENCYQAAFQWGGASLAATKFMFGIEVAAIKMIQAQMKALKYLKNEPKVVGEKRIPSRLASKYLIEQELLPVTHYVPDLEFMRNHIEKYRVAVGDYAKSKNTFLFQISENLAKQIGMPYVVVPGHHGSFMDQENGWATAIKEMIEQFH